MLTPREKPPLLEVQRRVKPMALHHAGQPAEHTTHWAIFCLPLFSYPRSFCLIGPFTSIAFHSCLQLVPFPKVSMCDQLCGQLNGHRHRKLKAVTPTVVAATEEEEGHCCLLWLSRVVSGSCSLVKFGAVVGMPVLNKSIILKTLVTVFSKLDFSDDTPLTKSNLTWL